MADPTGEADKRTLRLDFDRRLLLQFRGSMITSDAGLLPYRDLDDALNLTDTGADTHADARTGKNGRHRLAGLLRQSVFGQLAGYEDVNVRQRRRTGLAGDQPPEADPEEPHADRDRGGGGGAGDRATGLTTDDTYKGSNS